MLERSEASKKRCRDPSVPSGWQVQRMTNRLDDDDQHLSCWSGAKHLKKRQRSFRSVRMTSTMDDKQDGWRWPALVMLERSKASKKRGRDPSFHSGWQVLRMTNRMDDDDQHLSCWSGAKHIKEREKEILPFRQDDKYEGWQTGWMTMTSTCHAGAERSI